MSSLRFNTEKRPVIIDIGYSSWKIGFAGEGAPRCSVQTPPAVRRLLGAFLNDPTETLVQPSPAEAEEAIALLLRFIFFEQLLIKPPEHRLVICEHQDQPRAFTTAFVKVVFSLFKTPSILSNSCASFALHCAGCTSGLVVDVGVRETRVSPFSVGVPLTHASTTAAVGAHSLEKYLRPRVEAQWYAAGRSAHELTAHLAEVVKSACVVGTNSDAQSVADYQYKSEGCTLTVRGRDRVKATDVLFGQVRGQGQRKENENENETEGESGGGGGATEEEERSTEESSILTAIVDALLLCNRDCRSHVARTIVLTGGTAGLPGFATRLLAEIQSLVETAQQSARLATTQSCDRSMQRAVLCLSNTRVGKVPCPPRDVVWVGGSIVGSVDEMKNASISLQEWTEGKRMHDCNCV